MTQHGRDTSKAPISRRTQIVLGSFFAAMTAVIVLLDLGTPTTATGFPLTSLGNLQDRPAEDPVFMLENSLDRDRWRGIVIHHLGEPFGTAESVHRRHLGWGYQGLGYHFLIGNGNGLADGEVHVGYRWNQQLPGAHVVGESGQYHNERSIGICLVGNGQRRGFTDRQIRHLTRLVQRLQQELRIPADQVQLHSSVATGQSSPGRFFPVADFREQLLNIQD
ncbi:MAG: hypothetical protein CMJ40_03780 [Phycisphaerae bacterium]|nr:hypothetical protein [Phycisphaerae bacterium]